MTSQPVTIKGEDYAQAGMTDFTTAAGMRLAMFEAVKKWHEIKNPAERTAEKAAALMGEAARNNDLLKAAGTQEIVARFGENLMRHGPSSHRDPKFTAKPNAVGFLNAIQLVDVEKMQKFIADQKGSVPLWATITGESPIMSAASNLSSASGKYLGMGTLTETFIGDLKANAKLSLGVTILPKQLSEQQAKFVASYDGIFRTLDALSAPVQDKLAPPPKAALTQLGMDRRAAGLRSALGMEFDTQTIPHAIAQITNAGFAEQVAKQLARDSGVPPLPASATAASAAPAASGARGR